LAAFYIEYQILHLILDLGAMICVALVTSSYKLSFYPFFK